MRICYYNEKGHNCEGYIYLYLVIMDKTDAYVYLII